MNKPRLWFSVCLVVSTIVTFSILSMNSVSSKSMKGSSEKNQESPNASIRGTRILRSDTPPYDRLDKVTKSADVGHSYKILWYNPPPYLKSHPEAQYTGFSECQFNNCEMSFNMSDSKDSDAIIFDGRAMRTDSPERPLGQVWIFAAHESPQNYDSKTKGQWKNVPWRHSYNWTMTYNMLNTDIHLPYGVIKRKPFPENRNYTSIASKKNDSVLMISSHCKTFSKRHEYVDELRKYIPVTVLGACGTPWDCGQHYIHDNCFDLLNTTYKYFLAFENALCTQYFTEKIYENFNYDIIMVVRGGKKNEELTILPNGTFISVQSFKSAKDLGKYLRTLSESREAYTKMLERKSKFYSPGYKVVYQKAMCNLCKRMNFQNKYKKMIPNIEDWAFKNKPCTEV